MRGEDAEDGRDRGGRGGGGGVAVVRPEGKSPKRKAFAFPHDILTSRMNQQRAL